MVGQESRNYLEPQQDGNSDRIHASRIERALLMDMKALLEVGMLTLPNRRKAREGRETPKVSH